MRIYPVRENHTDSAVSEILQYRQTSYYFIIRVLNYIFYYNLYSQNLSKQTS